MSVLNDDVDYEEYIDFYLKQGDENALHSLRDLDSSAFPIFAHRFRNSTDPHVRAMLIEAINNLQLQEALPIFQEALRDPYCHVWNQAINGILAIDSPEAECLFEEEITRREACENSELNSMKLNYLKEALELMRHERTQK